MESTEFKKWIQAQIRTELLPVFRREKMKKGRANCYIREQNNTIQFIQFDIKQYKVTLKGGISPIFYPPNVIPYYGFEILPYERNLCSNGIYVPIPTTGAPVVTPEAIEKWKEIKRIINEKILYQFNQISNLDSLMTIAQYDVPDRSNWNGVKWYVQGVYQCRFGDFFQGVELLKKARSCKSGYLAYLESVDCTFDINRDQFALVFHYIDLLYRAVIGQPEKAAFAAFLSVYEMICENSRKQYKL